jgi:hypothetical protein
MLVERTERDREMDVREFCHAGEQLFENHGGSKSPALDDYPGRIPVGLSGERVGSDIFRKNGIYPLSDEFGGGPGEKPGGSRESEKYPFGEKSDHAVRESRDRVRLVDVERDPHDPGADSDRQSHSPALAKNRRRLDIRERLVRLEERLEEKIRLQEVPERKLAPEFESLDRVELDLVFAGLVFVHATGLANPDAVDAERMLEAVVEHDDGQDVTA